jgi:hypothetical protein
VLVRSLSFTRECEDLSGDEGGVPGLLPLAGFGGARLGTVWLFDFFEDFVKREGRTMEAKCGWIAAYFCVTEFGSLQQLLVEIRRPKDVARSFHERGYAR